MRLPALAILTLFVVGCSSGKVQVVDPSGAPIQGAQVAPVSQSINGEAKTTNAKGEASIPLNIGQDTKWITVSKPGFTPQQVDVPAKWPLKVVLQPTTRPAAGALHLKAGMTDAEIICAFGLDPSLVKRELVQGKDGTSTNYAGEDQRVTVTRSDFSGVSVMASGRVSGVWPLGNP